jgi:hypothetical protein
LAVSFRGYLVIGISGLSWAYRVAQSTKPRNIKKTRAKNRFIYKVVK